MKQIDNIKKPNLRENTPDINIGYVERRSRELIAFREQEKQYTDNLTGKLEKKELDTIVGVFDKYLNIDNIS